MGVYWGSQGAGLLLFSGRQGGLRVLLTLRSSEVMEPGTWGVPGGAVQTGEQAYAGALREAKEELGALPPHVVFGEVVFEDGAFRYTTFLARVRQRDARAWEPELNWENDEARWFPARSLPEDLHFGVEHVVRERPDLFAVQELRRNADDEIRRLEREAATGDRAAMERLFAARVRAGLAREIVEQNSFWFARMTGPRGRTWETTLHRNDAQEWRGTSFFSRRDEPFPTDMFSVAWDAIKQMPPDAEAPRHVLTLWRSRRLPDARHVVRTADPHAFAWRLLALDGRPSYKGVLDSALLRRSMFGPAMPQDRAYITPYQPKQPRRMNQDAP